MWCILRNLWYSGRYVVVYRHGLWCECGGSGITSPSFGTKAPSVSLKLSASNGESVRWLNSSQMGKTRTPFYINWCNMPNHRRLWMEHESPNLGGWWCLFPSSIGRLIQPWGWIIWGQNFSRDEKSLDLVRK